MALECDRETIRAAGTPGRAKRLGRKFQILPGWEGTRLAVMREILAAKFEQHPELLARLAATGDAPLREGNRWHDNFWGDCACPRCAGTEGKNWLGRLLGDLRGATGGGG